LYERYPPFGNFAETPEKVSDLSAPPASSTHGPGFIGAEWLRNRLPLHAAILPHDDAFVKDVLSYGFT
jgi:hypothetical protein